MTVSELPSARPRPLGSLVASAQRLTSRTVTRSGSGSNAQSWQDDAWEMFDLVGEERFLATTLAGRLAQARWFVGEAPDNTTEDPEPTEDETAKAVLAALGSAPSIAQMVYRLGVNLFVAGDGWLVGIPRYLMPPSLLPAGAIITVPDLSPSPVPTRSPNGRTTPVKISTTSTAYDPYEPVPVPATDELEWRMLSVSEVSAVTGGSVQLVLGEGETERVTCSPDELFMIRIWRPHPRKWWEADSPTRASLPILRELVGLTMHISAQIDSRLAGAGLLIVPQSAAAAIKIASGLDPADDSDPFIDALMEAMLKPISDRANASALVPLVLTVPDETTDRFNFLTFAKPLDAEARSMRDEAIRRLALGLDAPPELLLGMGSMNHWGAWLVKEDVVTTHITPPLAVIADALTTQYLWPVLIDQGYTAEQAQKFVVWFDVSHMIVRPNLASDALQLHQEGVLSDAALRDANGFNEADAPSQSSGAGPAYVLALSMVQADPSLLVSPGAQNLVEQLTALINGTPAPPPPAAPAAPGVAPASPGAPPPPADGPPPTADAPAVLPAIAAGGRAWYDSEEYGGPGSGRYPKGSGKANQPAGLSGRVRAPLATGVAADFAAAECSATEHLHDGKFSEERAALHEKMVSERLSGVSPREGEQQVFNMLGGGPAAGKGVFIRTNPEAFANTSTINADDYKMGEAGTGLVQNTTVPDGKLSAAWVHEESSYLAKTQTAEGYERGISMTLDGTGDNSAASTRGKLADARKHGYKVNGYYVTCPTDVAVQRAQARAVKTGRGVPDKIIRQTHDRVSQVFPRVANEFDTVKLYDTDAKILIGEKKEGGVFTIYDKPGWDRFLAKRDEYDPDVETEPIPQHPFGSPS